MLLHNEKREVFSKIDRGLVFTGHRLKRRYLCMIDNAQLWLSGVLYASLADLAHARLSSATGATELSSVVAYRLRREINDACGLNGQSIGDTLVESCGSSEYRLSLPTKSLLVDESFFELRRVQLLPDPYFTSFEQQLAHIEVPPSSVV